MFITASSARLPRTVFTILKHTLPVAQSSDAHVQCTSIPSRATEMRTCLGTGVALLLLKLNSIGRIEAARPTSASSRAKADTANRAQTNDRAKQR